MPIKRDLSNYFSQVQSMNKFGSGEKKSYKVENAFTPVLKDGKYSIVIRFLPSHPDEVSPFVENRSHMFQLKNGSWFGCDCLAKFGKPCPICKYNGDMWKKYGKEEGKYHVLGKAKPKYVSNILVVRNPNATDTEGKVFRFEYGPLVMKMISDAMTDHEDPEAGLVKGFNPFDWKTGANFVFEGVQAGKYTKNDGSHFGSPKPINKWNGKSFVELSDEEIDVIESQLYTLADCERKEEDVKDYQGILDAYLKKNGSPLFPTNNSTNIQNATNDVVAGVIGDVDDDAEPVSTTADEEESMDNDDFFSRLSSN